MASSDSDDDDIDDEEYQTHFEKYLGKQKDLIEEELKDRHVKQLKSFLSSCEDDISTSTVRNYARELRFLIKKSYEEDYPEKIKKWTSEDWQDIIYECADLDRDISSGTKRNTIFASKKFIDYIPNSEASKDDLQSPKISHSPIDKNNVLSISDVYHLIETANTKRNKAMIALAFEAAIRRTALVQLDIRHYSTDKYTKIEIPLDKEGVKTGHGRYRPLSWSAGYIEDWLAEEHPESNNPDAPLFVSERPQDSGKRLSSHSFYTMLRRVTDRSDELTTDEVHPHALRHARATQLRQKEGENKELNKTDIEVVMGWTEGTPMHQRYEHIGEDEEAEITARKLGIDIDEGEEDQEVFLDECPRCGRNLPEVQVEHCPQCTLKLNNDKLPWWRIYQTVTDDTDPLRKEYDERVSAVPGIHNLSVQHLDHIYKVFLLSEQLMYNSNMFEDEEPPEDFDHVEQFESEEDADKAMQIANQRIKPKLAEIYEEDPSEVEMISQVVDSDNIKKLAEDRSDDD